MVNLKMSIRDLHLVNALGILEIENILIKNWGRIAKLLSTNESLPDFKMALITDTEK